MLKMSQTAASVNDVRINQKNLKNILTHDLRGAILNTVEKNSTRKEESECHTLMITEN